MEAVRVSALVAVAIAVLDILSTPARAEPRAVIELFTSQGCSSCPPADKLLGELNKDPTLIAVSLPVNYWDYLGWKDTLADPRHAARQKAYSHARGDRDVYTPQIVVNGAVQVLGSDRAAIERAVTRLKSESAALTVPLELTIADGQVSVSADKLKGARSGEVWLWGLASSVPVDIRRGENNGRTITYTNVVRRWLKLGDLAGTDQKWTVPLADIKGEMVDAVAAIIQRGNTATPGPIIGASITPLQ